MDEEEAGRKDGWKDRQMHGRMDRIVDGWKDRMDAERKKEGITGTDNSIIFL